MSDVVIFAIVFSAFFVLRAIAATLFFYVMTPESDRCPMCDQQTIRISKPAWNVLLPWFRTSWCFECGWEGLLRSPRGRPLAPSDSSAPVFSVPAKKSES